MREPPQLMHRFYWDTRKSDVFVIGLTYFRIWDWRYDVDDVLGRPSKVVRCFEISLWWRGLQIFWLGDAPR